MAAVEVRNRVPEVAELLPAMAAAGSAGVTVVIRGVHFAPDAQVMWDDQPRPTQFIGAGELRVSIPASDLATAGAARLNVVNPAPGGGASASPGFPVVATNVARVELQPTSATLVVGQNVTIAGTAQDLAGNVVNAHVTWSSSHPEVATITRPLTGRTVEWQALHPAIATVAADGRVRAVAPGNATIDAVIGGRTGFRGVLVHTPLPWDLLYEGTHGGYAELWLLTLGPKTAPIPRSRHRSPCAGAGI